MSYGARSSPPSIDADPATPSGYAHPLDTQNPLQKSANIPQSLPTRPHTPPLSTSLAGASGLGCETLRGFGASFHIVLQDLERLKGVYPKEYKSFLANSSVKPIMGLDDLDMAKVFSEISGQTHDVIEISDSEHASPYIKEKPVIPADELMKNWGTHYLLIKGMPNFIKMPKMKYFENPYFKGQYGKNPYY